ncbi:MAG: hypothetical protein KGO50_07680 [Myxococcales bacterium]|nr:hypothetical protein [Myxococcales bacterium]
MTLQTLVAVMIAGVQKDAGLIANKLARGRNRQVCINALNEALEGAETGTTCRIHDFVVDGENAKIKLAVYKGDQVVALVEFKLWMAVDILELVKEGKLTSDLENHGIYNEYKSDYNKLVAARNQQRQDMPVPLTASCTLVYFVDPADGVQIENYESEIKKGREFARDFKTNQTDMACNALVGMLIRKHSEGEFKHLSPHVKVSLLMDNVKSEQGHKVSLAAVWTEILPPTPNQPPAVLAG